MTRYLKKKLSIFILKGSQPSGWPSVFFRLPHPQTYCNHSRQRNLVSLVTALAIITCVFLSSVTCLCLLSIHLSVFFLLAPLVRELYIVVCRREDVQYRTTVMQLGIATFYTEKKVVPRMFTGTLSKQSFHGVQIYVNDAGLAQTLEKDFQFD